MFRISFTCWTMLIICGTGKGFQWSVIQKSIRYWTTWPFPIKGSSYRQASPASWSAADSRSLYTNGLGASFARRCGGSLREINSGSVARYGGCVVSGRARTSEARRGSGESAARLDGRCDRSRARPRARAGAMGTTPPPAGAGFPTKQHKSRRKISLPWFRQSSVSAPHAALSRQHTIDTPGSFHARLLKGNRQRQVMRLHWCTRHPALQPRCGALATHPHSHCTPAAPTRAGITLAVLYDHPCSVYRFTPRCINKQMSCSYTLRWKIKRFKYCPAHI